MRAELLAELGIAEATALDELTDADAALLLAQVRAARTAQHVTIQQAIDTAMEHVPWVFRAALKKILF